MTLFPTVPIFPDNCHIPSLFHALRMGGHPEHEHTSWFWETTTSQSSANSDTAEVRWSFDRSRDWSSFTGSQPYMFKKQPAVLNKHAASGWNTNVLEL